MLNVILDTSVFRQDPSRRKYAFKILERLLIGGHAALHVPRYVYSEYVTSHIDEFEQAINKADSSLKQFKKRAVPAVVQKRLDEIDAHITALKGLGGNVLAEHFDLWLDMVGAQVHQVEAHHAIRVTNAYFAGGKPFSHAKSRSDFPDAFIYVQIEDLVSDGKDWSVVTGDATLGRSCADLDSLDFYDSLESFVKSGKVQRQLTKDDIRAKAKLAENLLSLYQDQITRRLASELEEVLRGAFFEDGFIPSESHIAHIEHLWPVHNADIELSRATHLASASFSLAFRITVDAEILFSVAPGKLRFENFSNLSPQDNENLTDREVPSVNRVSLLVKGDCSVSLDLEAFLEVNKSALPRLFEKMLAESDIEIEGLASVRVA